MVTDQITAGMTSQMKEHYQTVSIANPKYMIVFAERDAKAIASANLTVTQVGIQVTGAKRTNVPLMSAVASMASVAIRRSFAKATRLNDRLAH